MPDHRALFSAGDPGGHGTWECASPSVLRSDSQSFSSSFACVYIIMRVFSSVILPGVFHAAAVRAWDHVPCATLVTTLCFPLKKTSEIQQGRSLAQHDGQGVVSARKVHMQPVVSFTLRPGVWRPRHAGHARFCRGRGITSAGGILNIFLDS
jgi:hypothetical protein